MTDGHRTIDIQPPAPPYFAQYMPLGGGSWDCRARSALLQHKGANLAYYDQCTSHLKLHSLQPTAAAVSLRNQQSVLPPSNTSCLMLCVKYLDTNNVFALKTVHA